MCIAAGTSIHPLGAHYSILFMNNNGFRTSKFNLIFRFFTRFPFANRRRVIGILYNILLYNYHHTNRVLDCCVGDENSVVDHSTPSLFFVPLLVIIVVDTVTVHGQNFERAIHFTHTHTHVCKLVSYMYLLYAIYTHTHYNNICTL